MSSEAKKCAAFTKAGNPCKNFTLPDSAYCRIHQNYQPAAEAVAVPVATEPESVSPYHAELKQLAAELNVLAQDLQKLIPDYSPPAYSPQGLRHLLDQLLDRLAPETRRQVMQNLREMVESTPIDEFRDVETWKGMWFTLNYLVSTEAATRRDWLMERLARLPGMETVSGVREMIASTPPQEFLNPETWKGIWFIVNYEVQNQAASLRRRLRGGEETEEQATAPAPGD
jgi:hypothetical protein